MSYYNQNQPQPPVGDTRQKATQRTHIRRLVTRSRDTRRRGTLREGIRRSTPRSTASLRRNSNRAAAPDYYRDGKLIYARSLDFCVKFDFLISVRFRSERSVVFAIDSMSLAASLKNADVNVRGGPSVVGWVAYLLCAVVACWMLAFEEQAFKILFSSSKRIYI
ncbi:tetratricopeptide repeat protein [Striga asiatica]|uniref:Tetratricopeptide repeat protein n=1 Tax=Striga asiatica TaxID=4170 RepID=A0A5A7QCF7_STRAF|nr:tetratricopeptide repeat protein [Striga asiatica]